jgi:cell fate regulator YaaT (PSP1 superfamily)
MSIFPLPVFEEDADPANRDGLTLEEQLARLEAPKTIVVRFGRMGMVGEYRSDGEIRPGCGSKLVARTHRGVEMTEMLTTTCTNAGCGKSVTRNEMRSYIDASGGSDYPFHDDGRILRIASTDDLLLASRHDDQAPGRMKSVRQTVALYGLDMKVVDTELILSGDHLTVYYMAEDRIDFRDLVHDLAADFKCRIEMRQVGARDEARLVADYEKCGQHCCCKNFLKVLKPVSMRSAKQQKATLDPLKISGRCGRLMCCLRYEDQTYRDLKANLPHRKTRVGTTEGPGIVIDGKILTQLVLVELEHDRRRIAVPLEELLDPDDCPDPFDLAAQAHAEARIDPMRGAEPDARGKKKRRRRRRGSSAPDAGEATQRTDAQVQHTDRVDKAGEGADSTESGGATDSNQPTKKKRRRRRRRRKTDTDS